MKKVLFASLLILALLVSSSAVMFVGATEPEASGTGTSNSSEPVWFDDFSTATTNQYPSNDQFEASVSDGKLHLKIKAKDKAYAYLLGDDVCIGENDNIDGLTFAYTFRIEDATNNAYIGLAANATDYQNFCSAGVTVGAPDHTANTAAGFMWHKTTNGSWTQGNQRLNENGNAFHFERNTETVYTVIVKVPNGEDAVIGSIYENGVLKQFSTSNITSSLKDIFACGAGKLGICLRSSDATRLTAIEFDAIAIYKGTDVDNSDILRKLSSANVTVFAKGLACNDTVEMRFLAKFGHEILNYNAVIVMGNTKINVVPSLYTGELPEGYSTDDIIYEYRISLSAKQMTETVELSFKDNIYVNNASVTETVAAINTVEDYCKYQIANTSSSAVVKQVCAATLVYGYQAQVVFDYNTDKLPKLTNEILKLATTGISVTE